MQHLPALSPSNMKTGIRAIPWSLSARAANRAGLSCRRNPWRNQITFAPRVVILKPRSDQVRGIQIRDHSRYLSGRTVFQLGKYTTRGDLFFSAHDSLAPAANWRMRMWMRNSSVRSVSPTAAQRFPLDAKCKSESDSCWERDRDGEKETCGNCTLKQIVVHKIHKILNKMFFI